MWLRAERSRRCHATVSHEINTYFAFAKPCSSANAWTANVAVLIPLSSSDFGGRRADTYGRVSKRRPLKMRPETGHKNATGFETCPIPHNHWRHAHKKHCSEYDHMRLQPPGLNAHRCFRRQQWQLYVWYEQIVTILAKQMAQTQRHTQSLRAWKKNQTNCKHAVRWSSSRPQSPRQTPSGEEHATDYMAVARCSPTDIYDFPKHHGCWTLQHPSNASSGMRISWTNQQRQRNMLHMHTHASQHIKENTVFIWR